jgi:acetolactate synthase I/II/III large subunit
MPTDKLLPDEVSLPRAIAQVLEEAGIDLIFGIPGGRTGAIFVALYDYRDSTRIVLVREEDLAAVMADVYGRLTGKPGVAMGQRAFVLTNSGMGILEAFLAGSPMLLLSDLSDGAPFPHHGPYQARTGDYGTLDAKTTIGGYTKQVFVAREGAQAVQDTQLAIQHALAGQPGPVAVMYHSGALTTSVGPDSSPRLYTTASYMTERTSAVSAAQVQAAARSYGPPLDRSSWPATGGA